MPAALAEAQQPLVPIDAGTLVKALSSCLTLVAGVGMGQDERKAWLASATMTLKDWPEDLIRLGVEKARRVADHPAKIVPNIVAATESILNRRREDLRRVNWIASIDLEARGGKEEFDESTRCTPEQAAAIIAETEAEFGIKLRADLTGYVRRHEGPPRAPTRQDYIDMGIDPSVLDSPVLDAA